MASFIDNLDLVLSPQSPDPLAVLLRSTLSFESTKPTTLDIGGLRYDLTDDGARHFEPHQWIRRFQDSDAMVYVVSLPGYCQMVPGSELHVRFLLKP